MDRESGKRDYDDLHFAADDEKEREEEIGDDWAPPPLRSAAASTMNKRQIATAADAVTIEVVRKRTSSEVL